MTADDHLHETQPKATPADTSRPRRRRLWLRLSIIAAVLAILAAIIFIAPTYVARHIAADQLAKMGIETEGVETIKIDVWNQEVWLGPVRFRNTEMKEEFGELERIGVRMSLSALFKQYLLIERVIIEGIHIDVVQHAEGVIRINGVSPAELGKSDEQETPSPEDEPSSWLAGLDSFELRNSSVTFTNAAGGRLKAEIDSLVLDDFYGWSPEDPGTFSLSGNVNRIPLSWEGKAWPFADTIRASADGQIRNVELAKIEEFTGPLGLERKDGVINPTLHYEVTWTPDGRLTIGATGQVDMSSIDVMPPDGIGIQIDNAVLNIDNQFVVDDKTNIKATGQTSLAVTAARIKTPDGASVKLPQTELGITNIDVDAPIEGQLQAAAAASLEIIDPSVAVTPPSQASGGSLEVAAARVSTDLPQVTFKQSSEGLSLELKGDEEFKKIEINLPSNQDAAPIAISVESFSQTFSGVTFRQTADEGRLQGTIELTVQAMGSEVPVEDVVANITAQTFILSASSLDVAFNPEGQSVKATGSTSLDELKVEMPKSSVAPALDASINRFVVDLKQLALNQTPDNTSLKAALLSEIDELAGNLNQGEIGKISFSKLALKDGTINGTFGKGLEIAASEMLLTTPNIDITDQMFTAFGSETESKDDEEQPSDSASAKVKIGRFAVKDQGQLVYVDTSVEPRVRVQTDIELLEADNIDTGDKQQPTNVKLDAKVNEFTKVQLVGWVTPFLEPPTFEFAGRIGDLALPTLSPYAAQTVGMNLQQGSLTAKADATAKDNGNLRGRIDLDVNNLAFTPLSKEDAERLSAQIGLPIDTIIGLLKDSDGEIDLKIPISGDIDDPNFDFTDAIAKALTGAVTAAITAPFQVLFAPVQMVADAASGAPVAFKPVTFPPGSQEINAESRVFLNALVEMLNKRPDLRLQVCGHATAQDFQAYKASTPAQDKKAPAPSSGQAQANPVAQQKAEADAARPQLQKLAEERGRTVRRFIVEENNIKAERIGECRAEVDTTDQGPPRVEISF